MHYPTQGHSDAIHNPSLQFEIQLLRLGAVSLRVNREVQDVKAPFWRLHVYEEPVLLTVSANERTTIRKRKKYWVYLIPPWVEVSRRVIEPVNHIYIHFNIAGLRWLSQLELRSRVSQVQMNPKEIKALLVLGESLASGEGVSVEQHFKLKAILFDQISSLLKSEAGLKEQHEDWPEELTVSLDYIQSHLHEKVGVDELAELASCSESHLRRLFKKHLEISPVDYLLQQRVALASEYLTTTEMSIEEIAENCGFSQRYYFSRVFKRWLGTGPAQYRKDHQ